MIINIFDAGVSNGSGPVNYVLSDKDHTGKTRSVKPEILEGDADLTRDIIDSIKNKNKYTSGVISFRKNENLTKSQLFEVIDSFKQALYGGLGDDRINGLFVLHRDKGFNEIHFVIPKIDLQSKKALNISPPGQQNQHFFRLLQNSLNEKYGFDLVIPNRNKLETSINEVHMKNRKSIAIFKASAHERILFEFSKGRLKTQDDVIKYFEKNNLKLSNKGCNFITVEYNNIKIRFGGNLYSKNPLFTKNDMPRLTSRDYEKLEWYKEQRQIFFNKRYNHEYKTTTRVSRISSRISSEAVRRVSQISSNNSRLQQAVNIITRNSAIRNEEKSRLDSQYLNTNSRGEEPRVTTKNVECKSDKLSRQQNEVKNISDSSVKQPSLGADNSSKFVSLGCSLTELYVQLANAFDFATQARIRARIIDIEIQLGILKQEEERKSVKLKF
ncbi:MAG TPA: relaxase/mobilization nuclease domain-containing protein [Trinickia sp.]|uniref:relaxase/mobilization nuclease domain-containing protein n=1 Tax=Trinickia sp. TaxID=2571163 RepID=UPI002CC51650|nr:relaxase/mobilization nuclease domain-containing protein [Trinickia sp.]HVW49891.1 relaxase/mobilization nuclease domain-containing protein [Trinickia sp.]